ncbi:MAG: YggS family pyridoxal phosphate enzyme, partial [Bacillota bacterium]|nr:YggS family pyridoxal phosphate enzyme [Bacillota bacterium]
RIETSFRTLARLRDQIQRKRLPNARCDFLSMRMTGDFKIAVRCGATHVRLGSILFRNEE